MMEKLVPFFAIADEKEFEDVRDNPVSVGGEVHVEKEYQSGKFVTISNDKIDLSNEDNLCDKLIHIGIL